MRRALCLMLLVLLMCGTAQAASIVDYWPDEVSGGTDEGFAVPFASISPSYSVGTSNLTLFSGLVYKLPYEVHYVYWRESQYVYSIAYGRSLELSGSGFTGSDVQVVTYNTYTGGGLQSTWTSSLQSSFSLSAGDYLVWSDLGDYPQLVERRAGDYAQTCCVILCSFALYYLFHHLWADIRQRYLDG